jgi:hypothetical protein
VARDVRHPPHRHHTRRVLLAIVLAATDIRHPPHPHDTRRVLLAVVLAASVLTGTLLIDILLVVSRIFLLFLTLWELR